MWFSVKPVLAEERRQGSGLVQDDRFDLGRAEHHPAASEAHDVREAGVRPDSHAVLGGERHGPVHDVGIARVIPAGHVGDVDDAHEFFVVAELVEAQAFTHVGVQEHTPWSVEGAGVTLVCMGATLLSNSSRPILCRSLNLRA